MVTQGHWGVGPYGGPVSSPSEILRRTPRLLIRTVIEADVIGLHPWLGPDAAWRATDAPYLPRPSAQDNDSFCAGLVLQARAGTPERPPRFAAIAERGTDTLLGLLTWYWEARESDWRRLGIVIYSPEHWRAGLGTEAFGAWTDYIFATTSAVRLDFATWSGHPGMLGVGRRLGFVQEARFRRARVVDGVRHDAIVMGVLREHWRTPPGVGP